MVYIVQKGTWSPYTFLSNPNPFLLFWEKYHPTPFLDTQWQELSLLLLWVIATLPLVLQFCRRCGVREKTFFYYKTHPINKVIISCRTHYPSTWQHKHVKTHVRTCACVTKSTSSASCSWWWLLLHVPLIFYFDSIYIYIPRRRSRLHQQ